MAEANMGMTPPDILEQWMKAGHEASEGGDLSSYTAEILTHVTLRKHWEAHKAGVVYLPINHDLNLTFTHVFLTRGVRIKRLIDEDGMCLGTKGQLDFMVNPDKESKVDKVVFEELGGHCFRTPFISLDTIILFVE